MNDKMTVTIIDNLGSDHQAHYWYGGRCATINYKGYIASIEAVGDVYWSYDGDSNYYKDKNNGGYFYGEMRNIIKNDTELYDAIESGKLQFDCNNWWECFIYDKNGVFHDLMWDLDSIRLDDAIEEVKVSLDEMIKHIEEEM